MYNSVSYHSFHLIQGFRVLGQNIFIYMFVLVKENVDLNLVSKTMNNGEEEVGSDFYAVLGVKKECTTTDLRNAYRKLAMRWHPDRCSASGNPKYVEEAKKKFQAIQEAYSVLSDDNKRLLYDLGLYSDDDEEDGMEDFISEMAVMMNQNKCTDIKNESMEDLQELFVEMFPSDMVAFGYPSNNASSYSSPSSYSSCGEPLNAPHKRNSTEMHTGKSHGNASTFDAHLEGFCLGMGETSGKCQDRGRKNKRNSRILRK